MVDADSPTCPFCDAPWTPGMLMQFEQSARVGRCGCCFAGVHRPGEAGPAGRPSRDLCCDGCGKAIYRAPALSPD